MGLFSECINTYLHPVFHSLQAPSHARKYCGRKLHMCTCVVVSQRVVYGLLFLFALFSVRKHVSWVNKQYIQLLIFGSLFYVKNMYLNYFLTLAPTICIFAMQPCFFSEYILHAVSNFTWIFFSKLYLSSDYQHIIFSNQVI